LEQNKTLKGDIGRLEQELKRARFDMSRMDTLVKKESEEKLGLENRTA
jgi:hypothetical protein